MSLYTLLNLFFVSLYFWLLLCLPLKYDCLSFQILYLNFIYNFILYYRLYLLFYTLLVTYRTLTYHFIVTYKTYTLLPLFATFIYFTNLNIPLTTTLYYHKTILPLNTLHFSIPNLSSNTTPSPLPPLPTLLQNNKYCLPNLNFSESNQDLT